MTHTERDFEQLSWHDCHVWAIELRAGDPDTDDWTSDLAFDIDFIVEWICTPNRTATFRVAPATLVFHGVTDPTIAIEWGKPASYQGALHPISIFAIERELIEDQKVFLDRPYYRWTIRASWPKDGVITFGAHGFTQTLRAAPIETARQHLTRRERI